MQIDKAVDIVWEASQQGHHCPAALQGQLTLTEAYQVQLGVLARTVATGEKHAGWKIGLSAAAIRQRFQIDVPVFGYLLHGRHFPSASRFPCAAIPNPALECELCFTLGETLRGPGVTRARALAAVAALTPALEIVSLRGDMAADLPLSVADNVSQWAFVTGQALTPYPQDLVLGQITLEMFSNGQLVSHLVGSEVIDDQLSSLAWLANQLADYGVALEAGQQVITGSFNPPAPVHPESHWEARFAGVGTVTAAFV